MIHLASPFPVENPRDEMEVIGPAVDGSKNVLEACAKTKGGVKRVVLTSSCASIYRKTLKQLMLNPAGSFRQIVRNPLFYFHGCWVITQAVRPQGNGL